MFDVSELGKFICIHLLLNPIMSSFETLFASYLEKKYLHLEFTIFLDLYM